MIRMNNKTKLYLCYLVLFSNTLCHISTQTLLNKDNGSLTDSNSLIHQESSLTSNSSLIKESSLKEKNTLIVNSDLIPEEKNSIGTYSKVVSSSTIKSANNNEEKNFEIIEQDEFVNNYGTYLNVVTSKDPLARHKFVTYFTEWQWFGQDKDFFFYSSERAEKEKKIETCYDNAIKRFGIGTAIIATTWVASIIAPGGTIVHTAVLVIAKATSFGALSGATFDGVFSAGKAIYQGKSTDEIIYETINGAASGYLFGAVAGIAEGGVHVAILVKNAKKISDGAYILFGKKLYDKSGKIIRDLSEFSDDALKALVEFLEHGDDIAKAIDRLSINYEQLNKLRLALERGEISSAMFWDKVGKNGWSKDICEEFLKGNTDFGRYLRNLIGNPPSNMIDPHAHHILPKTGKGPIQQALVEEGQKILNSYGIDPILGAENLCWAPNRVVGQHSEAAIREIVDGLKMLQEGGSSKEEIIDFLKIMGQKAAMRQ